MVKETLVIYPAASPLEGSVSLYGAKNAVLVIIVSLILTQGKSRLYNVPASADVLSMIQLLQEIGAQVYFNRQTHILEIDTVSITSWSISAELMKKTRASVLVMGALLARFGKAEIAIPGGDAIGARPIDYHVKAFKRMGAIVDIVGDSVYAHTLGSLKPARIILDYPSVGATENSMLAAVLTIGVTTIVNAALEPEIFDLIDALEKMGARIFIKMPATIEVHGVTTLYPIDHEIMPDRLEAGALLCAAAITGGRLYLPEARADHMEIFLQKLQDMGHDIQIGNNYRGIELHATKAPHAVSFKTGPYPGFPTDLQPLMMALQVVACGTSTIEETVHENRFLHVQELQKMGALIKIDHSCVRVTGVEELYGTHVIATDIRASYALFLAGLVACGVTRMSGVSHWKRGYENFERKIQQLGGIIALQSEVDEGIAEGAIASSYQVLEG